MKDKQALVLAFDVGTSSLRTALYDRRAHRFAASTAQVSYRLATNEPGMAELPPGALLRAARTCLSRTLSWHRGHPKIAGTAITAVGMSCFWHSLLGVNAQGEPLTPIYTWADARCQGSAARLRRELDLRSVHRRTGAMIHTSYWPAKLDWLYRQDPKRFARVSFWLSPGEWLLWQLAGIRACAHGMATGTGLYRPGARVWDRPLLERCRIRESQLLSLSDAPVAPSSSKVTGLPRALQGALWCPAIGDGAAGNLGSGADRAGTLAVNLGSSAAIREVRTTGSIRAPLGLFAYRIDSRRHLVGGAVSNAGNLRDWCHRELALGSDAGAIERQLARRPGPAHGLAVLPFWVAERAPTWRDDLKGAVVGFSQSSRAIDVLQAAIEAGYHRLAQILHKMRAGPDTRLIVSGGGSRGRANQRRLANVLGRPIEVCAEPEASARGAAVRALELIGVQPPPPRLAPAIVPDPTLAMAFAKVRREQRRLEIRLFGGG